MISPVNQEMPSLNLTHKIQYNNVLAIFGSLYALLDPLKSITGNVH